LRREFDSHHPYALQNGRFSCIYKGLDGEIVEWIVADKGHLILARKNVPSNPIDVQKKTTRRS
jgi:hypothetical protein